MAATDSLASLDLERLARRRSAKWSAFDADVLPAWVAEMDFPLAPPVKAALHQAIELDDCGYAHPTAPGALGESFAGFAARRMGWQLDPELVVPLVDVVSGICELLRVLTEPGLAQTLTGRAERRAPDLVWPAVAERYRDIAGAVRATGTRAGFLVDAP